MHTLHKEKTKLSAYILHRSINRPLLIIERLFQTTQGKGVSLGSGEDFRRSLQNQVPESINDNMVIIYGSKKHKVFAHIIFMSWTKIAYKNYIYLICLKCFENKENVTWANLALRASFC